MYVLPNDKIGETLGQAIGISLVQVETSLMTDCLAKRNTIRQCKPKLARINDLQWEVVLIRNSNPSEPFYLSLL